MCHSSQQTPLTSPGIRPMSRRRRPTTRREHPTTRRRGVTSRRRLAKSEAAFFAFAFVVAWRNGADLFHTWAAWVKKVSPPSQRDFDQPGLRRPRSLCQARPPVREEESADVVTGAVFPVYAVKASPRLGRDGLDHHPVRALEAGLCEQVLDPDVVPSPRACFAPGHVIESQLDPAPDHVRVVLGL
jgi:hypothetical protein